MVGMWSISPWRRLLLNHSTHNKVANDDDRKQRLEEIHHRIRSHPSYQRHSELEAFHTSVAYVFRGNFLAVLGALQQASTDPVLAMELVQNVRKPVVREAFMGELTRALHNYLASAHSIVDHARRLMRNSEPDFESLWKARVEEAWEEQPVMHFIKGLRNYSLHRRLPFFGSSFSVQNPNSRDASFQSEVEMSVDQLMEWDGWAVPARDFLANHAPGFALRPLIEEHGSVVYGMNVWLHEQLMEQLSAGLAEVNDMAVEYNAVLTGMDSAAVRSRMERMRREGGWTEDD